MPAFAGSAGSSANATLPVSCSYGPVEPNERPSAALKWRPLLTENVDPQILVGYGDPAVLKTDEG